MASFAEIENDLRATGASLEGTHVNGVMMTNYAEKMRRGANAIAELRGLVSALEREAELAAQRLEAFQQGEDLHQ